MRVALAADHAGFALKERLRARLASRGHEVVDLGAHDASPSDYPDHAEAAGQAVREGRAERAILACGSGVGVAAAANKMPGNLFAAAATPTPLPQTTIARSAVPPSTARAAASAWSG